MNPVPLYQLQGTQKLDEVPVKTADEIELI